MPASAMIKPAVASLWSQREGIRYLSRYKSKPVRHIQYKIVYISLLPAPRSPLFAEDIVDSP